jgi:hypothetical protein
MKRPFTAALLALALSTTVAMAQQQPTTPAKADSTATTKHARKHTKHAATKKTSATAKPAATAAAVQAMPAKKDSTKAPAKPQQ